MNVDKVVEVLNKRLEWLDSARQDVANQMSYIEELHKVQSDRSDTIEAETNAIYAALNALEAAFPTPVVDYNDIPF